MVSNASMIRQNAMVVAFLGHRMNYSVPHIHIIPSTTTKPTNVDGPSHDISQHMQMITLLYDNLMGSINPYGEVYAITSQITHISRSRLI